MSAKHTIPGPRGPEKDPSWFSWRHATNAEHVAAREAWLSQHGPAARRLKAAQRLALRKAGAR